MDSSLSGINILMSKMLGIELVFFPSTLLLWLICIVAFILTYNYLTKEPWKQLPPGPPALPLLGSLPFLGSTDIRESFTKLVEKYGDIYTIYMGHRRVVVLNGFEVIKEAFLKNGHIFSGRPPVFFVTGITNGYGIVSSQGPFWQEQRRYAMRILRDFGFGRSILENRILEEVNFLTKELKMNTGVPYYPQPIIQMSVANIISSITLGKRSAYDDPLFLRYMDAMNNAFEILGNSGVLNIFPFLGYLPGDLFKVKRLQNDVDYMCNQYKHMIEEHKLATGDCDKPSDFIAAYLQKLKEEENKEESTYSERQLLFIIAELFGAGTETSSTTLTWAIIYMSLHQDIQDRVQAEIDELIGKDAVPGIKHRSQMPFTEAVIMETQRLGNIVPLSVPHATMEDTYFRGYFIPKETMILANMYSVHHNPKLWPDPEEFKPERFLTDDGKLIKTDKLIPFSIGKRLCLGENLARMELFLFFTGIMQHFRFKVAPGYPLPELQGILGLTNTPKQFHVIIESRHE